MCPMENFLVVVVVRSCRGFEDCSFTGQTLMCVNAGGTAFNGVVEELKKWTTRVSHVLPVSDDGGSTAEIVRVVGWVFLPLTLKLSLIVKLMETIGRLSG